MESISNHTYLETEYPGVALGAVQSEKGLFLVDAPFRMEDQRAWSQDLARLKAGSSRLLVMLDPHIDRTLGVRAMETEVIGQENCVPILRSRPTAFRNQELDAGSDWEPFSLPANLRWALPELTYSDSLEIYWDDLPIILEHHPGSHIAGTWLRVIADSVVFIGDTVVTNQPPFLGYSDLEAWVADLELLLSAEYKGVKIVTSRSAVVRSRSIEKMRNFLEKTRHKMEAFAAHPGEIEDLLKEVPGLLKGLNFNKGLTQRYHNRLAWGLEQYYKRHYLHIEEEHKGEN
jgi:glyoxylase-like metal-dependent hydrolase (beta-lactamase superfamily II)